MKREPLGIVAGYHLSTKAMKRGASALSNNVGENRRVSINEIGESPVALFVLERLPSAQWSQVPTSPFDRVSQSNTSRVVYDGS
jgi:hypothetical protein